MNRAVGLVGGLDGGPAGRGDRVSAEREKGEGMGGRTPMSGHRRGSRGPAGWEEAIRPRHGLVGKIVVSGKNVGAGGAKADLPKGSARESQHRWLARRLETERNRTADGPLVEKLNGGSMDLEDTNVSRVKGKRRKKKASGLSGLRRESETPRSASQTRSS